jgi:anti-anti-sigma regulatory factor
MRFAGTVSLLLRRFIDCPRKQEIESMSTTSTIQAHISYELMDEEEPEVVVIEFLSRAISDPVHAHELGEQLDSLIRSELPLSFVIDFKNVKALGSTAFGEICSFARRVRWWGGDVKICGMHESLQLGASLIGLEAHSDYVADRRTAIEEARVSARRGDEESVYYPFFVS